MNLFFLNHEMFVSGSTYWNIGYGQMSNTVGKDVEAVNNMAFLLIKKL